MALQAGPTAAAISGSLAAMASMPTAIWAISTTCGSSILRSAQANGPGWAEAARVPNDHGGQPGVYGTLGTPAAGNIPGGRLDAASWTDDNGNLWLFGGSASMPTAIAALSTTFGSSILRLAHMANGLG